MIHLPLLASIFFTCPEHHLGLLYRIIIIRIRQLFGMIFLSAAIRTDERRSGTPELLRIVSAARAN